MKFFATSQLYCCRKTRKVSKCFVEILPHKLTLDPNYVRLANLGSREHTTLFREIKIVPVERTIMREMQEVFDG